MRRPPSPKGRSLKRQHQTWCFDTQTLLIALLLMKPKRHLQPFNKSQRAYERRVARRFAITQSTRWLDSNNHGVDHDCT